jgi:hypothetical protein
MTMAQKLLKEPDQLPEAPKKTIRLIVAAGGEQHFRQYQLTFCL